MAQKTSNFRMWLRIARAEIEDAKILKPKSLGEWAMAIVLVPLIALSLIAMVAGPILLLVLGVEKLIK